jgi:dienelactone hydrolase
MTGFVRFRQYGYALIALLLLSAAASSVSARDWADRPWLNKAGPLPGDGRTIRIGTAHGTSFIAYVNGPEDADTGVLLIHDRWGINRHVTAWADSLAGQGYRVLAVDLYDGREVQKEALADFVWRQIDPVWIEANLDAALRFLGQRQDRIAVSAWGKGIRPALELVGRTSGQVAALALYPDPATLGLTESLLWLPATVFTHPVDRSPVHLRSDRKTAQITEEALEATRVFLSGR